MVSNDTCAEDDSLNDTCTRIENRLEVQTYLQRLNYALEHGARITFQEDRRVDLNRNIRYTNRYTISDLFPNENPKDFLKKELKNLTIENYIQTVKDLRYKNKSEMREFGKVYKGKGDVYIKLRVELMTDFGNHSVFVMSFHYAEKPFTSEMFPYREK